MSPLNNKFYWLQNQPEKETSLNEIGWQWTPKPCGNLSEGDKSWRRRKFIYFFLIFFEIIRSTIMQRPTNNNHTQKPL